MSLAAVLPSGARALEIEKIDARPPLAPLEMKIVGRTASAQSETGRPIHRLQWPGVYFHASFIGPAVYFSFGNGKAIYHVTIDDQPPANLQPEPGATYRVRGLADARHTIRVELVTECQPAPVEFGGFGLPDGARGAVAESADRQIEFIGDSHTVGYGDTSTQRQCTPERTWSSTDTSQAFGPIVAHHYRADYQVNAISGRGIVRNYNGSAGDPVPVMYPFVLFDKRERVNDPSWDPQIVVVALGTNDFSTALNPGEKWKTRAELQADFERTYVQFVKGLRTTHARAFFILAANDGANGEIQAEVRKVIEQLRAEGEQRVGFVPFSQLEMTACDWHPSLRDQAKMAASLIAFIDAHEAGGDKR